MKAAVVMNIRAGTGRNGVSRESIERAFDRYGVRAEVLQVRGEEIGRTAVEAAGSGFDAVVSAGGDGTLRTVVSALLDGENAEAPGGPRPGRPPEVPPLGILPLGTVNHLARNLRVPLDLDGAARTLAAGRARAIDAAEVNGRLFLTDAMIGLPAHVLYAGEKSRRSRLGRLLRLMSVFVRVLYRLPLYEVEASGGSRTIRARAPMLAVTNNRVDPDGVGFGDRRVLDEGRLYLYLPRASRRLQALRLMFLAAVDRLEPAREMVVEGARELTVVLHRPKTVMVMVDGEFFPMSSPLRFRIRPRALRVLVP